MYGLALSLGNRCLVQVIQDRLKRSRVEVAARGPQTSIPGGRVSQGKTPAGQQQLRAEDSHPGGGPSTSCAMPGGRGAKPCPGPSNGGGAGHRRGAEAAGRRHVPWGRGACPSYRQATVWSVYCAGNAKWSEYLQERSWTSREKIQIPRVRGRRVPSASGVVSR